MVVLCRCQGVPEEVSHEPGSCVAEQIDQNLGGLDLKHQDGHARPQDTFDIGIG